jgi:hypothetical protein
MDQIQREKVIAKLVKIKAFAECGIGGEQQTAQQMYEALKKALWHYRRRSEPGSSSGGHKRN